MVVVAVVVVAAAEVTASVGQKKAYSCKVKLTAISPIHWNKVYLTGIRFNLTVVRYTLQQ